MLTSSTYLLAFATAVYIVKVTVVDACGFPMPAPPPPMMCGCGCGRKKREAVEPHLKDMSTPCPQTQWKIVMEENMKEINAANPANSIQSALYKRYSESKFLVICSTETSEQENDLTNKLELSSGGDGYCNVIKQGVWCQAVSLSA